MRSRVAWSVREKNAKWTPKPGSSNVSGPLLASRFWNRSLPSAVIFYTTRPRLDASGGGWVSVAGVSSVIQPPSFIRRSVG